MITDLNTQATTRGLNGVEIGSGGDTEAMFHWLGIGPPNQMRYDQLGYMGYPVTTPDLPRAYLGRAIKLETSLHHTVVTRNDFYTELLPLEYTNDLNINVTILNFTNTILEIEPYGGNSRYITSNIEQKSDKLLRRGIAFEIAHEFWKTQEGLQHYFMNFRVLESSTLMTIYFNIIFALLKHGNLYRDWEYKYANKALTIEEAAHLSKQKFGLLNKGMKEFRTYHARLTDYMKLNDCKPTHWVLPPGSKILMTHMHDSETEFYRAGSNALENREKGQEAASYLRGVKICETDLFEQQIVGDDPNPLTRLAEYGSFFVITNHWGSSHLDTYRSDERYAAMIMDASKDGLERKVVARDLFDLCFRFEGKGELSKYHQILADGDTIDDISKRLGHNPENRHIDMFIGVDNTKPAKHRNYVMQYIGEMYEKDLDKATLRNFAITACNSLQLSPEEIGMMRETKHFMDDLNSPDVNSNEFRAYIMAIALSGMPGGENYGGATDILKDNGEGCIMPPPIIPNEGLGCVINGTPTPLLFARRDGRWAAISRAAAAAANDADTYAAMGLPNFQGPQANPADPFTQLQNGRVLADDGLLFRVMKCIPYGFGSPTGTYNSYIPF